MPTGKRIGLTAIGAAAMTTLAAATAGAQENVTAFAAASLKNALDAANTACESDRDLEPEPVEEQHDDEDSLPEILGRDVRQRAAPAETLV